MGSSKTPDPVTPGEAAQAAVGTAGAGEMMAIANQPVEQYSNLATNIALGPSQIKAQQALANQAAYQGALAQRDIQSRVDPLAYAQREMRLKAATDRLGQLYNTDPSGYTFRAPEAYGMPGTADVAPLSQLRQQGSDIASNLSTAAVSKSGTNPRLVTPYNPQDVQQKAGYGYF